MIEQPRTIALRRPPVLLRGSALVADQFGSKVQEAESRWDTLQADRPEYFDGEVLAVGGVTRNGHGGVTLTVSSCPYRWYAVQSDDFDLGIRPLGAKAIVTNASGEFFCGQRSAKVHAYPNRWEFVPGGSVEPEEDPQQTVIRELEEESGLVPHAPPVAKALFFDPSPRTWEVVYELRAARDRGALPSHPEEHLTRGWFAREELPCPMTPIAERMVDVLLKSTDSTRRVDGQSS